MHVINKILLKKKYCGGLVEGVDLIFRIVSQISGQNDVSYKIQKLYWQFQIKKFYSCVLIGAKGYCPKYLF